MIHSEGDYAMRNVRETGIWTFCEEADAQVRLKDGKTFLCLTRYDADQTAEILKEASWWHIDEQIIDPAGWYHGTNERSDKTFSIPQDTVVVKDGRFYGILYREGHYIASLPDPLPKSGAMCVVPLAGNTRYELPGFEESPHNYVSYQFRIGGLPKR